MEDDINFVPENKNLKKQKKKEEGIEKVEWTKPSREANELENPKEHKKSFFEFLGFSDNPKAKDNSSAKEAERDVKPLVQPMPVKREKVSVAFEPEKNSGFNHLANEEKHSSGFNFFGLSGLFKKNKIVNNDKIYTKTEIKDPSFNLSAPKIKEKIATTTDNIPEIKDHDFFPFLNSFNKKKIEQENILLTDSQNLSESEDLAVNLLNNNLKSKNNDKPKQKAGIGENVKATGADWDNPFLLDTNLMREQSFIFSDWKKNAYVIFFSFIIPCVIIIISYELLLFWGNNEIKKNNLLRITAVDNEMKTLLDRINNEGILSKERKLPLIKKLMDNHIYWTNWFSFLEKNTLDSVYYLEFSGDTSGKYNLSARAQDLTSVDEQIKLLRSNKYVLEVSTQSARIGESLANRTVDMDGNELVSKKQGGNISFEMKLIIDPILFNEWKPNVVSSK